MFVQFAPTRVSSIYGHVFKVHFLSNRAGYVKCDRKNEIYVIFTDYYRY